MRAFARYRIIYHPSRRKALPCQLFGQHCSHIRHCSCTSNLRVSEAEPRPQSTTKSDIPTKPLKFKTSTTNVAGLAKPPIDHQSLAVQHGIFTTSPYSPGSPLLLPNGADMFLKLADFLRAQYAQFGFREVITPTIYKKSLWEKSGHWENYAEDMFEVRGRGSRGEKEGKEIGEDEEFGLKPMNCPGHCLLYASERHSYRDLPIRYADFSALHRNEVSGSLSGLTRVRRFHQDDGHIFCQPSQIEQEIKATMAFVDLVYSKVFDFGPYKLVLSTRPEKEYIGELEQWEKAEDQLKSALDSTGKDWKLNPGDGAFYGPKIDIILQDANGKEHQTATIQLDFQLPSRFDLSYSAPTQELETRSTTKDGGESAVEGTLHQMRPVMIHRAVLGSLERFMALLIEHYNGVYPFWIAPRPCIVMCINDTPRQLEYMRWVAAQLSGQVYGPGASAQGSSPADKAQVSPSLSEHEEHLPRRLASLRPRLNIETDGSPRSLGKKNVSALQKGYGLIVVIGENECETNTVSLKITKSLRKAEEVIAVLLDIVQGTDELHLDDSRQGYQRDEQSRQWQSSSDEASSTPRLNATFSTSEPSSPQSTGKTPTTPTNTIQNFSSIVAQKQRVPIELSQSLDVAYPDGQEISVVRKRDDQLEIKGLRPGTVRLWFERLQDSYQ